MTGDTHKAGGMLCAVAGFLLLKQQGLLLSNVNELVQLGVLYPFAMWGSTLPDTDHDWSSCPNKGVPNYLINKLLHITTPVYRRLDETLPSHLKRGLGFRLAKLLSANHRSWQTHSDLTLVAVIYLLFKVMSGGIGTGAVDSVDTAIITLMLAGVGMGVVAHFVLDMLTPQGIWFTFGVLVNKLAKRHILPVKLRVVPSSPLFSTGSNWEMLVCKLVKIATVVAVAIFLLTYISPDLLANYSISIK